ncbi:PP2C-domain-containing protein [Tothia fuscella]|uniref:PP2C-domain-containing protein n=1 Tax=Tothia fuscella TaxID=1048955 RepID=A0A9P4NEY9_9PEZI|nr:PP2C-domain-containing protein [Tothia fuscella]
MFGSSTAPSREADTAPPSEPERPPSSKASEVVNTTTTNATEPASETTNSPVTERKSMDDPPSSVEKKRRSSGVAKAKDIFSSAKQSFMHSSAPTTDKAAQTPFQKLSKSDPALGVPQGSLNNSAGESSPGPRSTFRVGVTEDKNKKCRRTMEDTHAYLYNFLSTPHVPGGADLNSASDFTPTTAEPTDLPVAETDNGYFAIFDGHAGNFAADWCGKKLHIVLEDIIRKNPNTPIPELLDQTFTSADQQLEKLPLKNSGCTAVTAVLRWEDRVPNPASATGSTYLNQAAAKAANENSKQNTETPINSQANAETSSATPAVDGKLLDTASRQRVLYTANVGDARIVLCRNGRALRLSYDHKGSDEQEGRRVANAGGLILNNRVNGVLAVTRALGDTYMKDLVTGHPYTTETVIQPDTDEFLILACDGLWDVCSDQEAVDLIRNSQDPQVASKQLVDHALARFSTDNLSCMVVRFYNKGIKESKTQHSIGVEGDPETLKGAVSEADAIVSSVKKIQDEAGETVHDRAANVKGSIAEEPEPGPELNLEAAEAARKH